MGENDREFIARGEVVMTLNLLARKSAWRKRALSDLEVAGSMSALRDTAIAMGVIQEVDKLNPTVEGFGVEVLVSGNSFETDNISRGKLKSTLIRLYEKYASESRAAWNSGDREGEHIVMGKFSGIAVLRKNFGIKR